MFSQSSLSYFLSFFCDKNTSYLQQKELLHEETFEHVNNTDQTPINIRRHEVGRNIKTALRLPPLDLKNCLCRGIMGHMTVLANPQEKAEKKTHETLVCLLGVTTTLVRKRRPPLLDTVTALVQSCHGASCRALKPH